METTRHFTASLYVVNDGATALHHHERLDLWLPPGGHIGRDELPHEAALRETTEETGLDATLVQTPSGRSSPTARPLPSPAHIMLEDINRHGDHVGHQHVDFIYYGRTAGRDISPAPGEAGADRWAWFDAAALATDDRLDPDVTEHAASALDTVASLGAD